RKKNRRRRKFAGQDYCAFKRNGDIRRERYCVSAVEVRIVGERFLVRAMEQCSGRRDGLGNDVGEGRGGRAALRRSRGGGLQRDLFAAGVLAASGGGGTE